MESKKLAYILSYFLLNFLWFFSKSWLGCNIFSLLFFLMWMHGKCKWTVLWDSWLAMSKFILVFFALLSAIFYLLLNLSNSRCYLVKLFGSNFLRVCLPDEKIVKKLGFSFFIAGLVKTFIRLIGFFTNY